MPIYEYRCGACGHAFETLRKTGDEDGDVACPACHRRRAERLMSCFGWWFGKDGGKCDSCDR